MTTTAVNFPARVVELLQDDLATKQSQWAECDDDALLKHIKSYREALTIVSKQMSELGIPVNLDDEQANGPSDPQAPEDPLGVEGVDWRLGTIEDVNPVEWQVPPQCIPIHTNVTTYDWTHLISATQFDVVMMDPPWQLATANPTRGVALGYSQLTDKDIQNLPIPKLQKDGLLFIWVINAKYQFTLDLFERWGYDLVDEVVWVKMTVNRRMAKSHGFYLQHAKEVCLVARKGRGPPGLKGGVGSDIIYSERRGQSQKPEEIYHLIEQLVPDGRYLEIFGRKNNLRNYWVTVGNEVTGQGLPIDDQARVEDGQRPAGAVYGAGGR